MAISCPSMHGSFRTTFLHRHPVRVRTQHRRTVRHHPNPVVDAPRRLLPPQHDPAVDCWPLHWQGRCTERLPTVFNNPYRWLANHRNRCAQHELLHDADRHLNTGHGLPVLHGLLAFLAHMLVPQPGLRLHNGDQSELRKTWCRLQLAGVTIHCQTLRKHFCSLLFWLHYNLSFNDRKLLDCFPWSKGRQVDSENLLRAREAPSIGQEGQVQLKIRRLV